MRLYIGDPVGKDISPKPALHRNDSLCLVGVVCCSLMLNITPILTSVGFPLSVAAALFGVFSPYSAFFHVAASQIVPDPPGFPLTQAQLFVAVWGLTLPVNGSLKWMGTMRTAGSAAAPFVGLWMLIGAVNGTTDFDVLLAFFSALILSTYLPQASSHPRALLTALVAGAALGSVGYWGSLIGLPVEGKVYEHLQRGGTRIGSGRADVNFASVNVGFFLWTAVTLMISRREKGKPPGSLKNFLLAGVAFFAGSIPLLAMGSRGGLAYLGVGGLATAMFLLASRSTRLQTVKYIALALPFTTLVLLVFSEPLGETGPMQMLKATLSYNSGQAGEVGGGLGTAGRSDIWSIFVPLALDYPLLGVPAGTMVDMGPEYGTAVVGSESLAAAHNVVLDIAVHRGIPLALLFLWNFWAPVIRLMRHGPSHVSGPMLIGYLMITLSFSNLSILNWKTFWALQMLAAFLTNSSPAARNRTGEAA